MIVKKKVTNCVDKEHTECYRINAVTKRNRKEGVIFCWHLMKLQTAFVIFEAVFRVKM
uniref:Uncharacterized protein n=1 Tax=virus sp. ctJLD79 TaxID=2827987 RepID=A0A8S5RF18_9VIRU|nr:MAG TPA: hypothetical protein [virus sp. ctJLD79]